MLRSSTKRLPSALLLRALSTITSPGPTVTVATGKSVAPAGLQVGTEEEVQRLHEVLRDGRVVVLTGAGVSTESGIPDYRSPGRPPHTPLQHKDFVQHAATRQRYWARSFAGWPTISRAQPSLAHRVIAALEQRGVVSHVITQNVDSLHSKAGTQHVTELHGRLADVVCTGCGHVEPRADFQTRLADANPHWPQPSSSTATTTTRATTTTPTTHRSDQERPDGDVAIERDTSTFVVPTCVRCGCHAVVTPSTPNVRIPYLRPGVVLFGDTVPPAVSREAIEAVANADALVVAGSSLTVWSGFRFARQATERRIPLVLLNHGPTRADTLPYAIKIDANIGLTLEAAAARGL